MSSSWRFNVGSWSTFGQTALLILATLLVTQVVTILLLRNIAEQWQNAAVVQPAVDRFAEVAQQVSRESKEAREQYVAVAGSRDQQYRLTDVIRFQEWPNSETVEDGLAAALQKRGVKFLAVRGLLHGSFGRPPVGPGNISGGNEPPPPGAVGRAVPPPGLPPNIPDGPHPGEGPAPNAEFGQDQGVPPAHRPPRFDLFMMRPFAPGPGRANEEVVLAVQFADGSWLSGRFTMHSPRPLLLNPIVVSEIVLFVTLLGLSLFWASRISKPLRILARAAEDLQPQEGFQPIPEKGPHDVRTAIISFNAMVRRVRDLIQEKDRMLSAIGHDLRTPLASLRLRAESIEPAAERERVVETIDEMTEMVDDILSLARLGHSTEPRLAVDLAALADSLVEEYRELGKDVTFAEAPRTPLPMQQTLVRRLLRNLIDNAIKYGERARVCVTETPDAVTLCVEDDGPGIPAESLNEVRQPFTRLEQSRSKETGGIGLGLTIADAIARGQGAELILENMSPAGLRASVRWPKPLPVPWP